MIIKANRHRNGAKLASYMMTGKNGERVELAELKGFGPYSDDIFNAFRSLHVMADAHGIECPLFHVQVRLPDHEEINREQWQRTADRVQTRLGLDGQARAVVFHIDDLTGERHMHLAFSLIDQETLYAKQLPFFKFRLKALARDLENEFDIRRVKNYRDGPIKYASKKNEQQQAQRLGVDKDEIRNTIRACWEQSDCGQSFQAALEHEGMILTKGDRRNLVIVDYAGGVHSLGKRILDVNKAAILDRLADLDLSELPSVEHAQSLLREMKTELQPELRKQEQPEPWDRDRADQAWEDAVMNAAIEQEKRERKFVEPTEPAREKARAGRHTASESERDRPDGRQEDREATPPPELGKTQAEIRLARVLSPGPQSFANALEDRGFILARITEDDIEKDLAKLRAEWEERRRNPQSWMEHEGGYAALPPQFQASARRSFEEWQAQKEQQQPGEQRTKQFTPDEYLTRVQKEWAEALRQDQSTDKSEAEYKKQLENYVDFVQRKWAEGPNSQLERATGGLAVVTPFGSVYTLTPRNTGLSRDELPEYLKGIDRAALLSVIDGQTVMQDVREHRSAEWRHQHEEWLMRQPIGATAAGIRLAYALTKTGPEFAAAIEDRGSILACMTDADAERLNRWERQRLKEERDKEEWAAGKEGKDKDKKRDLDSYNKYQAGELVVINQYGSVFQLTASTTGAHAVEREQRLKEIDRAPLMNVSAAQAAMQQYQQHQLEEWRQERRDSYRHKLNEKVSPVSPPKPERQSAGLFAQAATETGQDRRVEDLRGVGAVVWDIYRRSGNEYYFDNMHEATLRHSLRTGDRQAFAAALDERGISFARATKEEADRSHKPAEFARAIGNYSPRFKEGEIVIITEPRLEFRKDGQITDPRRVHKLDPSLAEKFVKALGAGDNLRGIDATLKISDQRAQERAAEREAFRMQRATDIRHWRYKDSRAGNAKDNLRRTPAAILKPASMGLNIVAKPAEILSNIIEGLFSPVLTPEQKLEGEIATRERRADAKDQQDHSNASAARAQERQRMEQEQAARDRQREIERDR